MQINIKLCKYFIVVFIALYYTLIQNDTSSSIVHFQLSIT